MELLIVVHFANVTYVTQCYDIKSGIVTKSEKSSDTQKT